MPTEVATGLFSLLFQNKPQEVIGLAEPAKEQKKTKSAQKHQGARRKSQGNQQVAFSEQVTSPRLSQPLHRTEGVPTLLLHRIGYFFF